MFCPVTERYPVKSKFVSSIAAGSVTTVQPTLDLLDACAWSLFNRLAWRCPTGSVLLPFYRRHLGRYHLDAGVGTGFYPAAAPIAEASRPRRLDLLDFDPNSLATASRRVANAHPAVLVRSYRADVMNELPLEPRLYDSIAAFYLLHCLPGTWSIKQRAVARLKEHLREGGVFYGATILGLDAKHNLLGRALMRRYNGNGVFGNYHDDRDGLATLLRMHFFEVEVRQQGAVALFSARGARY